MKKTKEYLEKLHYDHLAEMHFLEQERPFLTQFDDGEGLDTTKENKPLKND